MASMDGSAVKNLPAVQEMQLQSLGQDDPLEREMATHSSICKILRLTISLYS